MNTCGSNMALLRSLGCALAVWVQTDGLVWAGQATDSGDTNQPASRRQQFGSRGIRVHDPSTIVKCKDLFRVFYDGTRFGTPTLATVPLRWTTNLMAGTGSACPIG